MTTISPVMRLLNHAFKHVIRISELYKIDESHALKHSMEVFAFAKKIFKKELVKNPHLKHQEIIIYLAAIGHDMCDKKYMNETEGIDMYKRHLSKYLNIKDLDIIGKIIGTMSYSKVKAHGYPDMGEYNLAYHIVREADLLAAYDIDRCIIYGMYKDKCDYSVALNKAFQLFDSRVFKMIENNLFVTNCSNKKARKLHKKALIYVQCLKEFQVMSSTTIG
jgi:hypothetical protein